ncbi:MAG: peptidase U32 family protein [Coriobacteriia bacterium]|nr:peptidase U32 family protein [Coriobacteriia bacterium]
MLGRMTCAREIPMELLAPAGGFEQLGAAVRFGANAVYLAAERFGMRARAANFALEDLPRAVSLAHAAGVKVHLTCNVLMMQDDLPELPAFFEAVESAGVDALIIGDLGAFSLAGRYAPHVQLHVSTQASVANAESARMWHSLGAKRVVCAREMSLEDIATMRAQVPPDLQIEVFAHGAMCMAVSGRCLISSCLTGRSANKGHCTQPCRWQYALEEEKRPGEFFPVEEDDRGTFIMNAKDLNMLAYLRELQAAGVDSIKIEGRNKKAFYVATVVNAYRRVLDGEDPAAVASELETVSHRPYNTGFFFGEAQQAPHYDGYQQECLHVADVVGCEALGGADAAPALEGAPGADAAPAPDAFRVLVRCRNRWSEGDALEALIPRAATQAVTVRNLAWHPEPVDAQGGPVVLAETAADALEPAGLTLGPNNGASLGLGAPVPVPAANRSVALYSFESPLFIPAGSYLRIKQFRRSARHEDAPAGGGYEALATVSSPEHSH